MDASNWINVGLLTATLLGVVVAGISAAQARTSAGDAKDAAEAGERSAAALEEANELRRAAARKPRWSATRRPGKESPTARPSSRLVMMQSDDWMVINDGPGVVTEVRVVLRPAPAAVDSDHEGWGTESSPVGVLEQGLGGTVSVSRGRERLGDRVLDVTWCGVDGNEQHTALMLA